MLPRRSAVLIMLVLAGIAFVTVVPASAHQTPRSQFVDTRAVASPAESSLAMSRPTAAITASPGAVLVALPASPKLPWPILVGTLVLALVVRRRSRRLVVVTLVLLLAVLAFENGLHSVHHGLEERLLASCPLAVASAHLSATPAEDNVTEVILSAVAAAPEHTQPQVSLRALRAHQGRGPPSATA